MIEKKDQFNNDIDSAHLEAEKLLQLTKTLLREAQAVADDTQKQILAIPLSQRETQVPIADELKQFSENSN